MSVDERVKNLIFDDPKTYDEIKDTTGFTKIEIHNIFERIDAKKAGSDTDETKWVVRSGEKTQDGGDDGKPDFLSGV